MVNKFKALDAWIESHPVVDGIIKIVCLAIGIVLALFGAFVINLAWPIAW